MNFPFAKTAMAALMFAAISLSSCEEQAQPVEPASRGEEISFIASIGPFAKATDTAFEEGDSFSVAALAPINSGSVRLTISNGVPTPQTPIYWAEGQTEASTFIACYPYRVGDVAQGMSVQVSADQSVARAYTASDFMGAVTSSAPGGPVALAFKHMLSKIVITFTGDLAGAVQDVTIKNVPTAAQVNIANNSVAVTTSGGNVKACPVTLADGTRAWQLIAVPGTGVTPTLAVTMSDGTSREFAVDKALTLSSGHQASAEVEVNSTPPGPDVPVVTPVTFTFTITDWVEDADIVFHSTDEPVSVSAYSVSGSGGTTVMEQLGDGNWYARISGDNGMTSFVIVGENSSEYGVSRSIGQANEFDKWINADGTATFTFMTSGPVDIFFNAVTRQVLATEFEYFGDGLMVDDLLCSFIGTPRWERTVPYERAINGESRYRIPNAYFRYADFAYLDPADFKISNGYLYLNGTNPQQAYIEDSNVDLVCFGEYISVGSLCPENGFKNYSEYGTFADGQFTFPVKGCYRLEEQSGNIMYANNKGFTCFVLPNYGRALPLLSDLSDFTVDGQEGAGESFSFSAELDNDFVRVGVFPWCSTSEEINAAAAQLQNEQNVGIEFRKIIPAIRTSVNVDIEATGKYTAVAYTEGAGQWYYAYRTFYYLREGDQAPACQFSIDNLTLSDGNPESAIMVTASFTDVTSAYVYAMPSAQAANLSDSQAADAARSNGVRLYNANSGQSTSLNGLNPDTDYTVILCVTNPYDGSLSIIRRTIRTAAAVQWTLLGTGLYIDTFISDNYQSEVQIYKAAGQIEKYRVMQPYKNFWDNASGNDLACHNGSEAEYFDFYLREYNGQSYVVFSDYENGYTVPNLANPEDPSIAHLIYTHGNPASENPSADMYSVNNIKLADGVFSIAPLVLISGTSYIYAVYDTPGAVTVVLPGAQMPVAPKYPVHRDLLK